MNRPRDVAILIFDDVEVLDFCGPFEVFSVAGREDDSKPFTAYTVAENSEPIMARNNLSINPQYTIMDCPHSHILLVPGGVWHPQGDVQHTPDRLDQRPFAGSGVGAVCLYGGFPVGESWYLEGLAATTHHGAIELLKEVAPNTTIQGTRRIVDNGKVILSAGISAGIDMSLYVISKLLGEEQALKTAHYMEYDWKRES